MPKQDRPDEPGKADNHLTLTIVVSGQPQEVTVNLHETLEHAVREALRKSGNQGQPPSEWELRRIDGALVDQGVRAGEAGLADGVTLFLTPRAGAGGSA